MCLYVVRIVWFRDCNYFSYVVLFKAQIIVSIDPKILYKYNIVYQEIINSILIFCLYMHD